MANPEHVKILKQGVDVWNKWREDNPEVQPDFRQIDLIRAELERANLRRCNFNGANLTGTNFFKADLREADFTSANLIFLNLKEVDITGVKLYGTSRDDWKIDGIKCDYVYFDLGGMERTPKDRNFSSGEFEELYSWKFSNEVIMRTIKFPEEYKQAGISILNYFSEILRKKYPDTNATVQIKQEGLKVTMVVDPVDGEKEVIEKALNEYGLVVTGKMSPEEYCSTNPYEAMALRNKLELAEMELRQTRQLMLVSEKAHTQRIESLEDQVEWMREQIGKAIQKETNINIENKIINDSQAGVIGDNTNIKGNIDQGINE